MFNYKVSWVLRFCAQGKAGETGDVGVLGFRNPFVNVGFSRTYL